MATDRHHRRRRLGRLYLRAQPKQAAPDPPLRRPLSAAHQSYRKRPCHSLAIPHPARRRRRSLQNLKAGLTIRPISINSKGRSRRIFPSLSGLLFICHAAAPPARLSAGADCAQRPRKVCHRRDDRCPSPDHGRPRARADPLYPAETRAAAPDQPAQAPIAAPATTQDHRRPSTRSIPAVVKTFQPNP